MMLLAVFSTRYLPTMRVRCSGVRKAFAKAVRSVILTLSRSAQYVVCLKELSPPLLE